MSTVPPMITLAQAKDWLGIDLSEARYDGKLTTIIAGVSAKIAEYCGTDFALHTVDDSAPEILDGGRNDAVIPKWLPLVSVASLKLCIGTDLANATELDASDYQVYDWGISLKFMRSPQGRANMAIAYVGGYAAVPDDVVQAALLAVEAFYYRNSRKNIGISSRSKSVGSGTTETEAYMNAWDLDGSGLPKEAAAMLQSHKQFEWPSNQSMATRNY